LPTFVQPPTPAPPVDEWIPYRYSEAVRFSYPANWFVYANEDTITVTNFRLDAVMKGDAAERVKMDILITPRDVSAYPSLEAYLAAQDEEEARNVVQQVALPHEAEGYEVIRQRVGGLMGNPEATYTMIYLASDGKAMIVIVYGEKYAETVDRLVGTLVWRETP
jgi:hypothetical protein